METHTNQGYKHIRKTSTVVAFLTIPKKFTRFQAVKICVYGKRVYYVNKRSLPLVSEPLFPKSKFDGRIMFAKLNKFLDFIVFT